MTSVNKVDRLIQDCIEQLSDDRVELGVEALYELAGYWKSAGATRESFAEICQYIEREAAELSDSDFVKMKIGNALVKIREGKCGRILRGRLQ